MIKNEYTTREVAKDCEIMQLQFNLNEALEALRDTLKQLRMYHLNECKCLICQTADRIIERNEKV